MVSFPDSKVHGANMGPTWVLSAPDEPHVGRMNLAIRVPLPSPSKLYTKFHLNHANQTGVIVQTWTTSTEGTQMGLGAV